MNVGDINKSALSYLGVSASNPPNITIRTYAPTVKDYKEFRTGDYWLKANPDGTNSMLFILASKWMGEGIWMPIGGSGSGLLDTITIDGGNIISPVAANINLLGGDNINLTTPGAATINVNLNTWIDWPATSGGPNAGFIQIDGAPFMHAFGLFNTFLGQSAGNFTLSSATQNTAIGAGAGQSLTTGDDNVFIGFNAGNAATTSNNGVYIGAGAAENYNLSDGTIAIGYEALNTLTSGSAFTTCVGYQSLMSQSSSGGTNDAFGAFTGTAITSGANNSLFARGAGESITTGSQNVLLGKNAGNSIQNSSSNVAVGYNALLSLDNGGGGNIAIGDSASSLLGTGTTLNTVIGFEAADVQVDGSFNTIIGGSSAGSLTNASDNTMLGHLVARNLLTGNYNTIIGVDAGVAYTGSESNNILINSSGVVGDNNTIRIGEPGTHSSAYMQGIYSTTGLTSTRNVVVDSNGQLGTGGTDGTPDAFFAYLATDTAAFASGTLPTQTYFGALTAFTELYDDGNNFYPGDGAGTPASFTAPSDGKYAFNMYAATVLVASSVIGPAPLAVIEGLFGQFAQNVHMTTAPNTTAGASRGSATSFIILELTAGDVILFLTKLNAITQGATDAALKGGTIFGPVITPGNFPNAVSYVYGYQVSSN